MTEHPERLLSAYRDDALDGADRERVRAHLAACATCGRRLDELAATARLIAALPADVPTRSLVPLLGRPPVWLRPVRALGSLATGAFLFLFLASAVVNSGTGLGGGTTQAERDAERGRFTTSGGSAAAPSPAAASDARQDTQKAAGGAAPSITPNPAPSGAPASAQDRNVAQASQPPAATQPAEGPQASGAATALRTTRGVEPVGPPPAFFLGLAAISGLIAFVAHRRLRRT
ncbi:MAG TPA: zf-HC2 domain-containing protein [Candidatus Limnocylindria bacterium]